MLVVVLICGYLINQLLLVETVYLTDLKTKQGQVENAKCIDTETTSGVKFLVNYFGENEQDFLLLPRHITCKNILSRFIGGNVKITYFKNVYFGISLNEEALTDTEVELSKFNNKSDSIAFIVFISIISIYMLYLKGRHVTNRLRNGTRKEPRAP